MQANKLSKSNTSKLYRRKLQKRLLHHKQQLMNLQQAKKHFSSKMEESVAAGSLMDKETEHLVKTQDMLFKRQMRQYSSKVRIVGHYSHALSKAVKENQTCSNFASVLLSLFLQTLEIISDLFYLKFR